MCGAEGAGQLAYPRGRVDPKHVLETGLARAQEPHRRHVPADRVRTHDPAGVTALPRSALANKFGEQHQRVVVVAHASRLRRVDERRALRGLEEVAEPLQRRRGAPRRRGRL
eukprot:4709390-Pleurochrysis_carterae.AAC.1